MDITKENTLAEIVTRNPNASRIFDNYSINYSTEGKSKIGDACQTIGIKAEVIISKLLKTEQSGFNRLKISEWDTDLLCDLIINNHHAYIRRNLPKLISLSRHLVKDFKSGELLHNKLSQLKNEFEIHMQKEEKLIFPYIKRLNKLINESEKYETPPFGSVANTVKVIEKEHKNAHKELILMNALLDNMISEQKENTDIRTLNEKFMDFLGDYNFHIHLENNILFPKAIRLENKIKNKHSIIKK